MVCCCFAMALKPQLARFTCFCMALGLMERGAHISSSVSFLSALRAMVWNAESTFVSSFAETSKYGMLPLPLHHCFAFFSVTYTTLAIFDFRPQLG